MTVDLCEEAIAPEQATGMFSASHSGGNHRSPVWAGVAPGLLEEMRVAPRFRLCYGSCCGPIFHVGCFGDRLGDGALLLLHKSLVTVGQVFFDEEPGQGAVDVVQHVQRSSPIAGRPYVTFHTIKVDLTADLERLLAAMKKDTRYEVRRAAQQDRLVAGFNESGAKLDEFCAFYDTFAVQKRLSKVNRPFLEQCAETAKLTLSWAAPAEGAAPLVWHGYYRTPDRARLLYSASWHHGSSDRAYRNLVGRANRFLHWEDMKHFKGRRIKVYDFGGWYSGTGDRELLAINRFKEEFEGRSWLSTTSNTRKR